MSTFKDLTGQIFGRLVVICMTDERKKGEIIWKCICDCGNLAKVKSSNLRNGKTKSCGCLQKERAREVNSMLKLKHGDSNPKKRLRLYNIWVGIKTRCLNTRYHSYKYYGGRSISVCKLWRNSYLAFKWWAMSHGYADHLVIDRIDNDGNYEPSNCQWLTRSENIRKSNKERKRGRINGKRKKHNKL